LYERNKITEHSASNNQIRTKDLRRKQYNATGRKANSSELSRLEVEKIAC